MRRIYETAPRQRASLPSARDREAQSLLGAAADPRQPAHPAPGLAARTLGANGMSMACLSQRRWISRLLALGKPGQIMKGSGARKLSSAGPTLSAGPPGAVEAAAAARVQQAVPYIFDVTDANFMQKVIAPKHKTPILLDCHAEWSGPCKQLAPVLEAVVKSYDGRVILAKMDVDQSPQVANQMQIKSIPLLAGFKHAKLPDGREGMTLVGSVQGAPSEEELRKFIEEKLGVEPPQVSPAQQVAAAFDVLEQGDAIAAATAFNNAITVAAEMGQDEVAADATAGMLRSYMTLADTDPQAAAATDQLAKMLQTHPLNAYADRPLVSRALAAYSLFDEAGAGDDKSPADVAALAASGDLAARLKMAKMLFAKGSETDQQKAISEALQVLKEDRSFDDGAAQKLLLQFFEVLGPDSAIVSRGRRRMASMLFV